MLYKPSPFPQICYPHVPVPCHYLLTVPPQLGDNPLNKGATFGKPCTP